MSLKLRWIGDDERDRVAETRMLCYAPARRELAGYVERIRADPRGRAGDWLLAERAGDGVAVGTATGYAMTMWVRGGAVPCQGVAWVGTLKTSRRASGGGKATGEPGVATRVMNETLRLARERGQVVSALMPFRGSFYEHFGYGFVERRKEWTLPMAVLPKGDFGDVRFYRLDDLDELVRFKQRVTERGHGDIERPQALWEKYLKAAEDGHAIVDRAGGGPMRAFMAFEHSHDPAGPDTVSTWETIYEDVAALRRQLHFLGSLRDQYSTAKLTLPADLRLNLLLAETQMTHRGNRNHPTAEARPFNRMQVRVLDHVKLVAAMRPRGDLKGTVTVGIHETEGGVTKLSIDIAEGRATARATDASVQIEMPDRVWAPVVFGELPASEAHRLGLLTAADEGALRVLDAFAAGPAPYCNEYF